MQSDLLGRSCHFLSAYRVAYTNTALLSVRAYWRPDPLTGAVGIKLCFHLIRYEWTSVRG